MNFRGLYILILLSFMSFVLSGQSGNPFDIKARKSVPAKTEQRTKNPEKPVVTPKDTVVRKNILKGSETPSKPPVADTFKTEDESLLSQDSLISVQKPSGNNPFDISEDRIVYTSAGDATSGIRDKINVDTKTTKHISFIFWVILFSLIVLAFPVSMDRWYIVRIMRSLFNINISNSLAREFSGFSILLFAFLYLVFIISLSVFVLLFNRQFNGLESTFNMYLMSLFFIFAVYLVRHTGLLIAKWIFPEVIEFHAYNFTILSFNAILGIALIIPNLFLAFSPDEFARIAFFVAFGIILLFYGIRTIRGFMISFNYLINHPFHFFIYLCTFEILPLLTIYKLALEFN